MVLGIEGLGCSSKRLCRVEGCSSPEFVLCAMAGLVHFSHGLRDCHVVSLLGQHVVPIDRKRRSGT